MRLRSGLVSLWICVGSVGFLGCSSDSSGVGAGASSSGGEDGTITTATGTGSGDLTGGGQGGSGTTTTTTAGDTSTGGGLELELDCDTPPGGAVGAAYSHSPVVSGGMGAVLSWSASGLPDGLGINQVTGEISGVPTAEGAASADITVNGPGGASAMATCDFSIAASLSFDLSPLLPKPCIDETVNLGDYVTGGDGSPLTCLKPPGRGNGRLPDGITVNPDTCAIEGTNTANYGVTAWIVEVEQSSFKVHVPYCMAQPQQEAGAYQITVDHGGGMGNTLLPAVGVFTPGQGFSYGGMTDPRFEARGVCTPSACYYGYFWGVNSSPFDIDSISLAPAGVLQDSGGNNVGLFHHLSEMGPWDTNGDMMIDSVDQMAFDDRYTGRPFVQNFTIYYCLSTTSGNCSGKDMVQANGNGVLDFSIIMLPG